MDSDVKNCTVIQLRAWLKSLNLKSSGPKETLINRLCKVPVAERGEPPVVGESSEDSENEAGNADVSRRELEVMKREMDLLERENEFLKKMASMNVTADHAPSAQQRVPLDLLKELIPSYSGETNFDFWATQVKGIRDLYNVEETLLHAMIGSKLTGKALNWLHANVEFATINVEILLQKMSDHFGTKENKLILRRRFEARQWKTGESFADYFNEKNTLSMGLQLDEAELIDYIIEGIPDRSLRVQANLQCFKLKAQLLEALSKIDLQLEIPQRQQSTKRQTKEVRCYNCSEVGHYASACKQPKREFGACFGCGSKDHRVNVCPQQQKNVVCVESNDYVRNFKYSFNKNFNCFYYFNTLVDSGSPISFVRKSTISRCGSVIFLPNDVNKSKYFGLNKSQLITFGKILCFVILKNSKVKINMFVVADESVSFDIVLGRDFLLKSNSRIVVEDDILKPDCKINSDILKIDCATQVDCNSCFCFEEDNSHSQNLDSAKNDNEIIQIPCNIDNDLMTIEYDLSDDCQLTVGKNVNYKDKIKLQLLFEKCYVQPERPKEPKIKCEMKLLLNVSKPFSCPPRRISYAEKLELQKLLNEYLEKGYIQPSSSQYCSPIVLVRKKTGDLRMCIDYRTLNKITAKDNYPIPLIDDLLDRLEGKKIFTKLDLKNGFFHIFMDKDSIQYTSFVTQLGQFEFLRMPFGLKNAPSVFQRFINKIFADMVKEEKVILYLDDIMIATKSIEEHLDILVEVFKKLIDNKLELRLDKCEFLKSSITYLGYIVTGEGIKADDRNLQAVRNFPIPSKLQSVQSFLGLCSYFRRFIKGFSILAKPLYDLTKKDVKFRFGDCETECFELLKEKLIAAPVLALYSPHDETELHCDASAHGFGAILLQKKLDGKFHPVFFFSKRTTEVESKYHSFELETLAIIYALKRFRIYLQGRHFKIITDCNSLTLTLNKKEINPRIARWALELQNFSYDLEHRGSEKMQHVDALSRNTNVLIVETNSFEDNLIICQGKDRKIKELQQKLQNSESKHYEMRNGVIYRKKDKERILFYVPENMEQQIIHKYHDDMGHMGVEKVLDMITKTYWFPKLKEKISIYIENCLRCIVFSPKNGPPEGYLHIIPKGNEPFKIVHIDHFGPIDNSVKVKKYLLVVIDAFTKFIRLYSTKTTNSKEVIAALSDYFRAYSRPECIVSDRGSSFTSTDFKEFLIKNGIKHVKTATGSPQANGQVERVNRSIKPMIAKLVAPENGIFWPSVVEKVEFSINNSIHKSTGQHPSVMLFGKNQKRAEADALKEQLIRTVPAKQKTKLITLRKKASLLQLKSQKYNKKYFDKKRKRPRVFKIGDYVMVKNFDSHIGAPKKLLPKFKGPYRIEKVLRNDRYLLKDIEGFQQTQIPYIGVWAIGNIRPWTTNRSYKKLSQK